MSIAVLPPIVDAGPNDGTPSTPGLHYPMVDENPHDGDGTYIEMTTAGQREVFQMDTSAIPDGSQIVSLSIRWAAKKGQFPAVGADGFRIDGVYYLTDTHSLTANYVTRTEAKPHPDGQPWTKARIAAAFGVLELTDIDAPGGTTLPRFTQIVYVVDFIPPITRPTGTDAAVVPSASGSAPSVPAGTAQALAAAAMAAGLSPDGTALHLVGVGTPAAITPTGTTQALSPNAPISDPGKPSANPVSMDPSATVAPLSPMAVAAAVVGKGDGS